MIVLMATAADKKENSSKQANTEGKEGSESLRGNLVDVAVKFLNNPRVVNSPLDQKKAFLKKKGLSDGEIAEAVRLSSLTPTSSLPPHPPTQPSPFTSHTPSHVHTRTWRDYAMIVAVVGGVGYALYQFIRCYALPWLNTRLDQSERINQITTNMTQLHTSLNTTISEINNTTTAIRDALSEQQDHIQSIATQVTALQTSVPGSGFAVKEIREEMASLKGLLLNRHQFSSPTTSVRTQPAPGIPSWQRSPQPQSENTTDTGLNGEGGSEEEGDGKGSEDGNTVLLTN